MLISRVVGRNSLLCAMFGSGPKNKQMKGPRSQGKERNIEVLNSPELPDRKSLQKIKKFRDFFTANQYRLGYRASDFKGIPECVQRSFQLSNCSDSEIAKAKIDLAVRKYGHHERDTGSAAVQVAGMTEKILLHVKHLKQNRNDWCKSRFLHKLLCRRKRMMHYLMEKDFQRWVWVSQDYGLKFERSRFTDVSLHDTWRMLNTTTYAKAPTSILPADDLRKIPK